MSDKVLVVISCGLDNPNRATRGFHLATVAQKMGRDVKIFLLDDGVFLARKGMTDNLRAATGDVFQDLMFHVQEYNVPILACTPCAKARQIEEGDLVDGARYGTAMELIDFMKDHSVISL